MKLMQKLAASVRRGYLALVVLLATVVLPLAARADYAIVSTDGSGNVSFTPGGMVTPIIVGVVAAICAVTALVVLWVGARWLWKCTKGAK